MTKLDATSYVRSRTVINKILVNVNHKESCNTFIHCQEQKNLNLFLLNASCGKQLKQHQ